MDDGGKETNHTENVDKGKYAMIVCPLSGPSYNGVLILKMLLFFLKVFCPFCEFPGQKDSENGQSDNRGDERKIDVEREEFEQTDKGEDFGDRGRSERFSLLGDVAIKKLKVGVSAKSTELQDVHGFEGR